MEIRIEQRQEVPQQVEYIGLSKWHVRWNVQEVEGENGTHHEYNEVTLDHEPTQEEIEQITSQ